MGEGRPHRQLLPLLAIAALLAGCAGADCGRVTGVVKATGRLTYLSDFGTEKAGAVCRLDLSASSPTVEASLAITEGRLPRWSPDGTKIAWVEPSENQVEHVWLANVDGTGVHELASVGSPRPVLPGVVVSFDPAYAWFDWAPNGSQLVYAYNYGERESALYLIDAATGQVRNITPQTESPLHFHAPAWSPDGSAIVITGSPFNRQEGDPNGLYLVSPGGGALRPLAVGTTDLRGGGAWSPDGRQLVYWARVGEAEGLFVMDVGTRAERQLTSDWTDARGAWSPDGRWIAFSRRTSEHSDYPDHRHDDLWIVAADGGPEQVLLENGTVPKWMPTP